MAEPKMSVSDTVEDFCTQLRRRTIHGSLACARRTAEIMRKVVTNQKHDDAAALIDDVRSVGYRIQAAKPVELAIGNIVRRVLHLIREEAEKEAFGQLEEDAPTTTSVAASEPSWTQTVQAQGARGGLLSQALKTPGVNPVARSSFTSRALSLSNLLDVGLQVLEPPGSRGSAGGAAEQLPQTVHAQEETGSQGASVHKGHGASSTRTSRKAVANWDKKSNIIEAINDLIDELENITQSITGQGVEHLHANEVILTLGMSDTTFSFFVEAAKKREFQVVVAEGAPKYDGQIMGKRLAAAGIHSTVISDSAVFAMMARANKVIVGAHGVMANGGVIAPSGMHMVALAARQFSIPFVVLVGLHKLSPLFPHQPEVMHNEFRSPAEVLPLDLVADAFSAQASFKQQQQSPQGSPADDAESVAGTLHVPNPAFDYIPPDLISLFITDAGGYTPSYVYRLLTEYYSREDYLLSKELLTGR